MKRRTVRVIVVALVFLFCFSGSFSLLKNQNKWEISVSAEEAQQTEQGRLVYSDGSAYDGDVLYGKIRNGSGIFTWSTGESYSGNWINDSIDGIGEALIYGAMVKISGIMILICPIILLIIDNWKYIFTRKIIKIFLIVGIGILLYFPIHNLITTTKVSDNIPSVVNFEDELKQRGFAPYKANYRLYGISSKNKKAIKLSFDENKNEKYPLYVYSVINYPWLIYYANGEIYAVSGKYWDYYTSYNRISGYNEEKIMWTYGINNDVITETEKIS